MGFVFTLELKQIVERAYLIPEVYLTAQKTVKFINHSNF